MKFKLGKETYNNPLPFNTELLNGKVKSGYLRILEKIQNLEFIHISKEFYKSISQFKVHSEYFNRSPNEFISGATKDEREYLPTFT